MLTTKQTMISKFTSLLSFLFILSFTGPLSAQIDSTKIFLKNYLGAAAGITTGYGLSYRFCPNKAGIQLTFAPTSNKYHTRISAGLTFLFRMVETERANLFIYQGNHFLFYKDTYTYYYGNSHTSKEYYNMYNGIGLGIEFIIVKRVSLNIMGGYAAYENFNRLSLTGETGLFFKF